MLNIDNYSLQDWLTKLLFWLFGEQRTPASRPARSLWISKTLGEFWRKLQLRRFATLRFLAKTAILFFGCVSWTKSELFSKTILTLNDARLVRSLRLREQKPKIFLTFLIFLGGGVWGEPTKNGKEIFGFASPLQTTKWAISILSLFVISCRSFLRPCGETRCFLSAFGGSLILCSFVHWSW